MKELRFQDDFYYLVRADTEGEVSTEGMVSFASIHQVMLRSYSSSMSGASSILLGAI